MTDLLSYIESRLLAIHPRVEPERVSRSEIFPYITFKLLPYGLQTSNRTHYVLEVDIWGNNPDDTTDIDGLMEATKETFRVTRHLDTGKYVAFELLSAGMVIDPDPDIRRRQVRLLTKHEKRN